jgi:hypothetical protein
MACAAFQRPCGGRMGPAPAQSPSRCKQTIYPWAYPLWCPTPRAASAPPSAMKAEVTLCVPEGRTRRSRRRRATIACRSLGTAPTCTRPRPYGRSRSVAMHAGVKRSSGLHQCVSASRLFRVRTNEKKLKSVIWPESCCGTFNWARSVRSPKRHGPTPHFPA